MFIGLIILVVLITPFVLNYLYKRTNHYSNQYMDVLKFKNRSEDGEKLQIVNVGSNHPKFGFDYTGLDVKGENWAVGPQTFEYDFAILRKNAPYLALGAVVVVPICLQNFFLYRQKNRAVHAKYYAVLEPKDIVGYNIKEKISNYLFPLLFHPKYVRYILKDIPKDIRLELLSNPFHSESELIKDASFWINCWNKEFGINIPSLEISEENKRDIQQNIRLLKEMIEYCNQHGFKPVIAILPVTDYLSSRFSEDYLQTHVLRYIKESVIGETPVMNYLEDSRFTDASLYINSFFFNQNGRRAFTKQFVSDLQTKGIL